jgi:myosin-5
VLQAIRLRYAQKEIYTYSGIVLIATNPFARVDSLYVPGMVQVYAGKQRSYGAPHLFAIAEEAFAYVHRSSPLSRTPETGALLILVLTRFQRHVARPEEPDDCRLR